MSMTNSYDPYEEMHRFYGLDDPTEEDQFRFVEAMQYLIRNSYDSVDIRAFSYNLAMYYRDIREFHLEKKYLEIGAELGEPFSKEHLGLIWYYGLCGSQDYEKAFQYFNDCKTRRSMCMLSDMYRYGQYVRKNAAESRKIIEDLFIRVESERKDYRFASSTLFPEIALRLVQMDLEEGEDDAFDLDCLLDARDLIAIRQQRSPFWGNIKLMRSILETTAEMVGNDFDFIDLYDLLTFDHKKATITFDYEGAQYLLNIFFDEAETIFQFDEKWYHGAEDFLEKARINHKRITSVFDLISEN